MVIVNGVFPAAGEPFWAATTLLVISKSEVNDAAADALCKPVSNKATTTIPETENLAEVFI